MTSIAQIKIGSRVLDIEITSYDREHRTINWRLTYEQEFNEHGRLICCGCYEQRLEKITREEGAIIEAALWEIIDRKEQVQ